MDSLSQQNKPLIIQQPIQKEKSIPRFSIGLIPDMKNYTGKKEDRNKFESRKIEVQDGLEFSELNFNAKVCNLCYDAGTTEIITAKKDCDDLEECRKNLIKFASDKEKLYIELIAPFTALYDKPNIPREQQFQFESDRMYTENINKIAFLINQIPKETDVVFELGTCQSHFFENYFREQLKRPVTLILHNGFLYNENLLLKVPESWIIPIQKKEALIVEQDVSKLLTKDAKKFVESKFKYQFQKVFAIFNDSIKKINPFLLKDLQIDILKYEKLIDEKNVELLSSSLKVDLAKLLEKKEPIKKEIIMNDEILSNLDFYSTRIIPEKNQKLSEIIFKKNNLVTLNQKAKDDKVVQFDVFDGQYGPLITKRINSVHQGDVLKLQINKAAIQQPNYNLPQEENKQCY